MWSRILDMSNIWTGRNTQGFSKKILYVSYQLVAARQLFVVSVKECDNFTVCIKSPATWQGSIPQFSVSGLLCLPARPESVPVMLIAGQVLLAIGVPVIDAGRLLALLALGGL